VDVSGYARARRYTDIGIVTRAFYRNVPQTVLTRSCEKFKVPLVLAGSGEEPSMYTWMWRRMVDILKNLRFEKIAMIDLLDAFITCGPEELYDRLPNDRVVFGTDYQKVPHMMLTPDRPIHPLSPPEFVQAFTDPATKLVYAPNGGTLIGGPRLLVIQAIEKALSYAEHFSFIESNDKPDNVYFPFVKDVQRRICKEKGEVIRDEQHCFNVLFFDEHQHRQSRRPFAIPLVLDKNKDIATTHQENHTDGNAVIWHFAGGAHALKDRKYQELVENKPVTSYSAPKTASAIAYSAEAANPPVHAPAAAPQPVRKSCGACGQRAAAAQAQRQNSVPQSAAGQVAPRPIRIKRHG